MSHTLSLFKPIEQEEAFNIYHGIHREHADVSTVTITLRFHHDHYREGPLPNLISSPSLERIDLINQQSKNYERE